MHGRTARSSARRRGLLAGLLGLAVAMSGGVSGMAGVAAVAVAAGGMSGELAVAGQVADAAWETIPLPAERPLRLEAPQSGAFFVVHAGGLLRSDDGGTSWRDVALPPGTLTEAPRDGVNGQTTIAVDPTNHATIYAAGAEGLYKTEDDARSWRLLSAEACRSGVVVSRADPSLLYCLERTDVTNARLMRSRDGGESWEAGGNVKLDIFAKLELFRPHAADAARLFVAVSDHNGFNPLGRLLHSANQGATWEDWGDGDSQMSWTMALVGGEGIDPDRFYKLSNWLGDVNPALRGSASQRDARRTWGLARSDDGGRTWQSLDPQRPSNSLERRGPGWVAAPLIYDPAAPDRVYAAVPSSGFAAGSVQMSADGGASWVPLPGGPAATRDLILGVDRANLYALGDGATLHRLPLTP